MDWKFAARTSCVLIGGSLLLAGCMTPGVQQQTPPGFSSTFQQFDSDWQAIAGQDGPRYVTPAGMEEVKPVMEDVTKMSSRPDVRREELGAPK